jgi:hypothetical protein
MNTHYFKVTTMHLVEVGKGAWHMGGEKHHGTIGFRDGFKDDPRASCDDPTSIEKAVLALRDQGMEDPMVCLSREFKGRLVEIQVSLWNNGKSFEWVTCEY